MKDWIIFGGIIFALFFYFSYNSEFSLSSQSPSSSFQDKESSQSYKGYECTDDCSGHQAGYEWARKKGITDPDDCGGNSQSFIEGCKSYAVE